MLDARSRRRIIQMELNMKSPKTLFLRLFTIVMIVTILASASYSPAKAVTYATVSGTLKSLDGETLTGMSFQITLTGGGNTYFTYSTTSGTYSISSVVTGVTYALSVSTTEGFTNFANGNAGAEYGTLNVTVSGATTLTLMSFSNNAYYIKGKVFKADGVTPIAGATVTATNTTTPTATVKTTTSAADGSYTFTMLAQGNNYTTTASKAGYIDQSFASGAMAADVDPWNFTLTAQTYTIGGTVTCPGGTCPTNTIYVRVTDESGGVAFAELLVSSTGTYLSAANYPPGSYILNPGYWDGAAYVTTIYSFSPSTQAVNVVSSNVTQNFTATAKTYKISGYVKTPNNVMIEGATVTITNSSSSDTWTTTTNSSGYYEQANLPASSTAVYIVSVEKSPFTFSTTSPTAPFALTTNTSKTFTSEEAARSITGTVTGGGVGVAGVTITATSALSTATATTDSNGAYTLSGLLANSATGTEYTITPSKSGMTFSPTSTTVTLQTVDLTANFTTSVFSISGTITDDGSTGKSGLTVTAGGKSATTASDGTYTISNLPAGDYTVVPSPSGYFNPASQAVTVNDSTGSVTGKDFRYLYSISGTVTAGGVGVQGVTMSAYTNPATSTYTATTDSNGNYTITGLPINHYYVSASKTGYTFVAATSNEANFTTTHDHAIGINFTATVTPVPGTATPVPTATSPATYSVSGWVEDTDGAPVVGATVSSGAQSTTTNNVGYYTLTGVPSGTYTVKVVLSGYTFASKTVTVSGANLDNINFSGTRFWAISGQVTLSTSGALVGATVSNTTSGTTTSTDSSGNYIFSKLSSGTYTIVPSMSGYTFSPTSRSVTVGPDATSRNFVAYVQQSTNGGFESGSSSWNTPATAYTARITTEAAYTGSASMRVGITNTSANKYSYSSAMQTISIPSNTKATLGAWLYPTASGNMGNDMQYVLVLDRYGRIVEWLLRMQRNDNRWLYYSFDLSDYAGQTIKILFGVYNDGYGGVTGMYVDDVSLTFTSLARSSRSMAPMVSVRQGADSRIGKGVAGTGLSLVANGSFETTGSWEIKDAAVSQQLARVGSGSLMVGVADPKANKAGNSYATQLVTVTEENTTLGAWLYPFSSETKGKDVQSVLLLDRNNRVVDTLLWMRKSDQKWQYYEFDLSAYMGQAVKVYFGAYNDGQDGVTGMFVDDVKLR
jgi:hypothetical protein